jgi:flavin-dependent dehydrogenase
MDTLLFDADMARKAKKNGVRIYKRDPNTDLWKDKDGKQYKLERHGRNRLDLVPVEAENVG